MKLGLKLSTLSTPMMTLWRAIAVSKMLAIASVIASLLVHSISPISHAGNHDLTDMSLNLQSHHELHYSYPRYIPQSDRTRPRVKIPQYAHVLYFFFGPTSAHSSTNSSLAHFIGDIGQPLHCEAYELGGNDINEKFDGKSTELHAVWDTGMPEKTINNNFGKSLVCRNLSSIQLPTYSCSFALTGMLLPW